MDELVTVLHRGAVVVVCLRGELDLLVADHLSERVGAVPLDGAVGVVVDAAHLTFLDCAAFGVLARLARRCADLDLPLVIARARPIVHRVLSVHNADLPITDSLSDALALVSPPRLTSSCR